MDALRRRGGTVLVTVLAAMAVLARPGASDAQTGTLTDDAYASPNAAIQAANLNGAGPAIVVTGSSAVLSARPVGTSNGFLRFSLATLPDGTTEGDVARATLTLYVSFLPAPGSVRVGRVTSPWAESTLTPAAVPAVTPEGSGVPVSRVQSFVTFDVTQLVKDWISGHQANLGVALLAASDTVFVSFDSKENPITSHQPTLDVVLFTGESTGTPGPTGPAGPAGAKGLNWQGAWSATVDYVLDDAVRFEGSSWRALRASSNVSPIEGDDWTIVAQKGEDGEDGSVSGGIASISATSPISISNPTTTPVIGLDVVPAANGGTGLSAPGPAGAFLRSGGSTWISAPLGPGDMPAGSGNYIQNSSAPQAPGQFNIAGNGAAAVFDAATQFNIAGNRVLSNAGPDNLFIGGGAGASNTTVGGGGFGNTFIGSVAGASNTLGIRNTYVGSGAGTAGVFGAGNTFVGSGAGLATVNGSLNTFVGLDAGARNTDGGRNVFLGRSSGIFSTTGGGNTYLGTAAGFASTTGGSNTFVGDEAGNDNTTGSNNVFLGSNSGNPNISTQVDNSVAIGAGSIVSTSNTIVLGTNVHTTRVPGQVEVVGHFQIDHGLTQSFAQGSFEGLIVNNLLVRRLGAGDILPSPAPVCFRLGVNGTGSDGGAGLTTCTSSSSSIRYKKDLQPFTRGVDLVSRLKPTLFTWKASDEQDVGLIAEEVAEVEPLFTYRNADGEIEGVKYSNLSVVFITAIQEQQRELADLRAQIDELRALLAAARR